MSNISAHVASTLGRHVEHVFGVMGNGNAYFLDALYTSTDMTFTATRHEAGSVAAADAYYRASQKMAAATVTYGAGFTNAITPLVEASQAGIPLILVAGDEPSSGPRPWDVDQISLAAAVGVKTFTVGTRGAAATTMAAIEHALRYQTPVVVSIPYDFAAQESGEVPQFELADTASTPALPQEQLAHAAKKLAAAQRPVIIAGRGAWVAGASTVLGDLARATGAVTSTTALARGIFPDQQYDLGVTGGFGAKGAMQLIQEADVALVVGAALNQFTTRFGQLFSSDTHIIQIDTALTATHPAVNEYLRGDAKLTVQTMLAELDRVGATPSTWRASVDVPALRTYEDADTEYAPDGRLDPRAVARRIGELLPADRVVVSDGGHFIGWANMYWPVEAPDRMMMVGTAFQTIGLGIHTVAGAAQAKPDSTVVLTSGDGGGLMALSDLETAVRTAGGRGMAVIWNDAVYGAELNLYGLKGLAQEPMVIPETDFASLASAVGADSVVVRSLADLDKLEEWSRLPFDERKFLVLDCRISPNIIAPYQREIIEINS